MKVLTVVITIAIVMNPGAPGWNILEWFQNNKRNVELVYSITVLEQTFYKTVLEKYSMLALEKF